MQSANRRNAGTPARSGANPRPAAEALQAAEDGRLVIDLARLDEDGEQVEGEIPIDQLDLDADDLLFRPKSGLRYSLDVRLLDGILFARGRVEQDFECTCVRCGDDFKWTAIDEEVDESEEDVAENSFFDLTDSLRECIILCFPCNPVCREDCMGVCPRCGKNLNRETCSCATEGGSRWGALEGLEME